MIENGADKRTQMRGVVVIGGDNDADYGFIGLDGLGIPGFGRRIKNKDAAQVIDF